MAESSESVLDRIRRLGENFTFLNPLRISQPPSEDWHNDYLLKRQGQEYTKLNVSDLCKLGESWISMFYGGTANYISPVTVMLALHLKDPVNLNELFSPMDQNPKSPPGFKGDPEKEMIKCSQLLEKVPVFLASENRSDDVEKLKKKNTSLRNLVSGIKLMKVEEQAAFYSFLAAITCRIVSKSEGHVAGIWERKAVDAFKNFYKVTHVNFVLSSPDINALKYVKMLLSPGRELTVALYKAFLPVYSKACVESEQIVKRLLEFTFLLPTSMAGLGIITYVMKVAHLLEIKSLKELSLKIHCNGSVKPMETVTDFMKSYPLAQPPLPDCDWWKWARNINTNSFLNLSLKSVDIRRLAIICMAFLATSENDDIWKAQSVKATETEIRIWMQALKSYKNLNQSIFAQRPSDFNFNIEEEFKSMHL